MRYTPEELIDGFNGPDMTGKDMLTLAKLIEEHDLIDTTMYVYTYTDCDDYGLARFPEHFFDIDFVFVDSEGHRTKSFTWNESGWNVK